MDVLHTFSCVLFVSMIVHGVSATTVQPPIVQSQCPDGWTVFKGSCYNHGHTAVFWSDAEMYCRQQGAHLAHLDTPEENAFMKSYLADLTDPYHWIGLTDIIVEGIWKWNDTDTETTFTDWYPGQPEQGVYANCAVIWASLLYKWADEPCARNYKPLCERPFGRIEFEIVG